MARPFVFFAVVALVGLAAMRFVLGTVGVAGFLCALLVKLAVVCAVIYFGILIVSPDTARKMREHFLGPTA